MSIARLKPDFRGDWTPLVSAMSEAIGILEGKPHRNFELRLFGDKAEPNLVVRGYWDRVRGIVFEIPETPFTKKTLTKDQELTLLLTGWRRNHSTKKISYIYALHGKLRTDFLGGAVVDAVREIIGDAPDTWFELLIDGQIVTKVNSELFEASKDIVGRFRVRI
jgi:hypothetical protein